MGDVNRHVNASNKVVKEYSFFGFIHWFSDMDIDGADYYGEVDFDELVDLSVLLKPLIRLNEEAWLVYSLQHDRGYIHRSLAKVDLIREYQDRFMSLANEIGNDSVVYAIESRERIVVLRVSEVLEEIEFALSGIDEIESRLKRYMERK